MRDPTVRGLNIILLTDDAERLRGALAVATAHGAMGGAARLFLQMDAVTLLRSINAPRDDAHRAAGLPTLAILIDEALALGVQMIACQSGLALAGIDAGALDPRIGTGGAVSFLQGVQDSERLILV